MFGVLDPEGAAAYIAAYDDAVDIIRPPPPPCHLGTGALTCVLCRRFWAAAFFTSQLRSNKKLPRGSI